MQLQQVQQGIQAQVNKVIQKTAKLDRWDIYHTLGKGFSSKVKLAQDRETGEQVAIKLSKLSAPQAKLDSIRQEAKILAEVESSNIINQKGFFDKILYEKTNGKSYEVTAIVLEIASAGDLFEYIAQANGFKEPIARKIFSQIAGAVKTCHDNSIAHRDIKPGNLLFDSKFNLKLADFGFALSNVTSREVFRTEAFVGTENFAAPEIYTQDSTYDPKAADIFALGVTLFVLRCGTLPFHNANSSDRFFSFILNKDFAQFWRLHMMRRGDSKSKGVISSDFKDLIAKMLSADPKERPTIDEVLAHDWLGGETALPEDLLLTLQQTKAKIDLVQNA